MSGLRVHVRKPLFWGRNAATKARKFKTPKKTGQKNQKCRRYTKENTGRMTPIERKLARFSKLPSSGVVLGRQLDLEGDGRRGTTAQRLLQDDTKPGIENLRRGWAPPHTTRLSRSRTRGTGIGGERIGIIVGPFARLDHKGALPPRLTV